MPSATLVIADYPIGYASGFGETLYNLFRGFPEELLFTAYPGQLSAAKGKERGQLIHFASPTRPGWLPPKMALAYYPMLKARQWLASIWTTKLLGEVVRAHAIKNLLAIPVSPWILSAALALHRQNTGLKLVLFVMDDWQGHHKSHGLPYTRRRQNLLSEAVQRAATRFAVSREMAEHYEEVFGKRWNVAHNGVELDSLGKPSRPDKKPHRVLLAGDVNIFRFDAVIAFARSLERYNQRWSGSLELTVLGEVAGDCTGPLASLHAVKLLRRTTHAECLQAMRAADLLYLPLAFGERCTHISRYSLPTKLPEYLVSGKAVLFHAPRESAVFQVAERYDLKPRIATTDAQELDSFVEAWASAEPEPQSSSENRINALVQEFDLKQLSGCFQAAFD
jgi:hypothetical protein